MFANFSVVPISSKHTGCPNPTYCSDTLTEISSRGDADFDRAHNAKCSGGSIIHRSTRRSCSKASISLPSFNLPNPTKSVGVHQLARVDLEPSSGQPTDRGRRSLPNLELHVGQVQDRLDALVDT